MARSTVTVVSCDQEPPDKPRRGEFASVRFSLDGQHYETELCSRHGKAFSAMVTVYAERARRVRAAQLNGRALNGQHSVRTSADREQAKQVRTWLIDHGRTVPLRGRIPLREVEYYEANHGKELTSSPT